MDKYTTQTTSLTSPRTTIQTVWRITVFILQFKRDESIDEPWSYQDDKKDIKEYDEWKNNMTEEGREFHESLMRIKNK